MTVAAVTVPQATLTTPSRARSRWRIVGIVIVNTLLVATIIGLLVATWLPAYVYHHPDVKIGESQAK